MAQFLQYQRRHILKVRQMMRKASRQFSEHAFQATAATNCVILKLITSLREAAMKKG